MQCSLGPMHTAALQWFHVEPTNPLKLSLVQPNRNNIFNTARKAVSFIRINFEWKLDGFLHCENLTVNCSVIYWQSSWQ